MSYQGCKQMLLPSWYYLYSMNAYHIYVYECKVPMYLFVFFLWRFYCSADIVLFWCCSIYIGWTKIWNFLWNLVHLYLRSVLFCVENFDLRPKLPAFVISLFLGPESPMIIYAIPFFIDSTLFVATIQFFNKGRHNYHLYFRVVITFISQIAYYLVVQMFSSLWLLFFYNSFVFYHLVK